MKRKMQILSSMIAMILCFTLTTSQVHAVAVPIGVTPTVPVVVAGTSVIPVNLDTILNSIDRGIGLVATGNTELAKAEFKQAIEPYHKSFISTLSRDTANNIGVYTMKKEASVAVGETVAQYVPVVATYVKDGVTSISQKLVDAYTKWMIEQGVYDIPAGAISYPDYTKTDKVITSHDDPVSTLNALKAMTNMDDGIYERALIELNKHKGEGNTVGFRYFHSTDIIYSLMIAYGNYDIGFKIPKNEYYAFWPHSTVGIGYDGYSVSYDERSSVLLIMGVGVRKDGEITGSVSDRFDYTLFNINGETSPSEKGYALTDNIATLQGDDVVLPTGWTGDQTISDVIGNIVDGLIQGTDIPAVFPVDSTIPITLDLPIDSVIDGLAWPDLPDITWPTDAPDVITNTYEGDNYTTYEGTQTSVFDGRTTINEGDITNIYEGDLTKVYPVASDKPQTGEGTKDITYSVDVPVDDTFIEKMVNWALEKLNGTTGLLSKFPFSVPYDMYLIVNALSGNTGGNLLSDVKTVSVSGLNAPSEKYAVGTKNMDFTIPFVVAEKTYDIDIPISKVSWLFQYIKYGNGILFTIGALRWVVKKE